jgi:hypothetical protein
MVLTTWIDDNTGQRLSQAALRHMRQKARRAYRANTHIFEDETEALTALGVIPMPQLLDGWRVDGR